MTPRTVKNFRESQRLSAYRLGFSVTKACPLRCAHCSVSAEPNLKHTSFDETFTRKVIAEMSDIHKVGIQFIDFTGGEPTVVPNFVIPVAEAAKRYGISTGITSAAPWATNEASTERIVKKFSAIDNWDISTDVYHLEFVQLKNVELAFKVLSNAGKPPLIRIAYHEPLTYEDAKLIDTVYKFAGRRIGFQPIGPVGRAESFIASPGAKPSNYDKTPCPSTGVLIQAMGNVAPCCAPLSHEEYDHPLKLGNAFFEPISGLITKWRTHPLLQTIRVWGFRPVIEWLKEAGLPYEHILKDRSCNLCVELVRNKSICDYVYERSNEYLNRIKLAYVLKKYFKEKWMGEEVMKEADLILQN